MRDAYADLLLGAPVDQLVPGDPVGVDQLAQTMLRWSELFADAAQALRRIEVVWTGQAADAFQSEFQLQPAAFTAAATAMDDAGYALGSYGIAFHSARDGAAIAADTFQRGMRAGLAARAVAKTVAAAAGGFLPTTTLVDLRDEPAGLQDRLTGVEKLTAVRDAFRDAGDRAATTVRDAMAHAPEQVSALDHAANFYRVEWNQERADFTVGAGRGVLDMAVQSTMPLVAPLIMRPVNTYLDDVSWRWNIGTTSGWHQGGELIIPAILTGGGGGAATAVETRAPRVIADTILPKGVNEAPQDLVAMGNATLPTRLRIGPDIDVDVQGSVNPQAVKWPKGQSTFKDPRSAGLTGFPYLVPEGTPMPAGVQVIRDGREIGGPRGVGHATIFPTERMSLEQFQTLIWGLPWQRGEKIKKPPTSSAPSDS